MGLHEHLGFGDGELSRPEIEVEAVYDESNKLRVPRPLRSSVLGTDVEWKGDTNDTKQSRRISVKYWKQIST